MFQEDVVLYGNQQVGDVGEEGANQHGKADACKVNEAAVAEDAAVGVAKAEGHCIGDEQDAEVVEDGPEMPCDLFASVEEVVGEITAENDDGIVDEQDAPIGERVPAKVPIDDFR